MHGLGVEAELRPGDDLQHLFEGAVAAGEDQESVGELGHAGLALVHGLDKFEAREAAVGDFAVREHVRQNADDLSAGGKGGVGDCAHEADFGSAVDEAEAGGGDGLAEGDSFRAKGGELPSAEPQ